MKRARGITLVVGGVVAGAVLGALAGPGDGINIGNLTLSPFVDLSATYDSNVFLTKYNEEQDIFADMVGGLAFVNRTDVLNLRGRGWGQLRRYDDFTEKDSDDFGERLGLTWGEMDKTYLVVNEKYARVTDYELTPRSVDTLNVPGQYLMLTEDRTERTKRDLFDIGGVVGRRVTDKLEAEVGYSYGSVDYDTDLLFDWHENKGQAEVRHQVTDKTWALLTGQYSLQASDGFTDESQFYVLRGGFLNRTTAKTTLKAGVGLQDYNYRGVVPPGENFDTSIVSYDVTGNWDTTEKLNVEVSARNGIQPATQYGDNTKEITLLALGLSYDLTPTVMMSLGGSFRRDDYVGRVVVGDVAQSKQRDLVGGRLRIDYRPRVRFCDIYLEGTYEDVNDNLEDDYEDYDQWRLVAGILLRY